MAGVVLRRNLEALSMMTYIGSPAQITWAIDIRGAFIEKCPEELAGREIVCNVVSAKWWIDHRNVEPARLCLLAVAGRIPPEFISVNSCVRYVGVTRNHRFLVTCDDPKRLSRYILRIPGSKLSGEFQFTVDDFMAAEVMDLAIREGFRISDDARQLADKSGYVEMVPTQPAVDGIIDDLRDCG